MSLFKNEKFIAMGDYSICKLIANDIISYGIEDASSNRSLVYLDNLFEEYDDELDRYVKEHLDEIIQDVRGHETVTEESKIYYDEDGKLIFDLYFKDENLFDSMENEIKKIGENKGAKLEFDDIKAISQDVMKSNEYKSLLSEYVENKLELGNEKVEVLKNKSPKKKENDKTFILTIIIFLIAIPCIQLIMSAINKKNALYGTYIRNDRKEDIIMILKGGKCKIKAQGDNKSKPSVAKAEFDDCTWKQENKEITFKYKIYADSLSKNNGIPQKMIGTLNGKKLTTDDGAIYTKK